MSEPAALEVGVLDELCAAVDGDRDFVADLAETFLTDGARQLDELEAACTAGDAAAAVRPAHTLKSSSATVGGMSLAAAARQAEATARAGDVPTQELALMRGLWMPLVVALRSWIDNGGSG
ncbi:MAG: Hpt domain-containing protein [Chloroflexota bacterium]